MQFQWLDFKKCLVSHLFSRIEESRSVVAGLVPEYVLHIQCQQHINNKLKLTASASDNRTTSNQTLYNSYIIWTHHLQSKLPQLSESVKDTRRAWCRWWRLQQYSSPCGDGRSLRSGRLSLRRACVQNWTGPETPRPCWGRSWCTCPTPGLESPGPAASAWSSGSSQCFLRLCLNSRIVLVYLLMVVTEEAMQAVKELQAKLEEKTSRGFQINICLITRY